MWAWLGWAVGKVQSSQPADKSRKILSGELEQSRIYNETLEELTMSLIDIRFLGTQDIKYKIFLFLYLILISLICNFLTYQDDDSQNQSNSELKNPKNNEL